MSALTTYYQTVENCIESLGINPIACRGEKEGQWTIISSGIKVWIDVWHIAKEDRSYFQVMAPVVKAPTNDNASFYRDLLVTNDKLFGVAFTIFKDWSWLKSIRETENLDESEILAAITRIGNYAEKYKEEFNNKYFSETTIIEESETTLTSSTSQNDSAKG